MKKEEYFSHDSSKRGGLYPSCKGCYRTRVGHKKRVPRVRIIKGSRFFRCPKCNKSKSIDEFYSNPANKDGVHSECKECSKGRARGEVAKTRQKSLRQERRVEVLIHYGGFPPRCICCGEMNIEFLCIDHPHGGGKEHRRKIGTGHFYEQLIKSGFPLGLRVLCHNCNMSTGFYGYCPHEKNIT